jgi:microcin C transport system substrate-binding protein
VREALGLMFDFEWTNRTLFSSAYRRATSYYPNSEFAASGLPVGKNG